MGSTVSLMDLSQPRSLTTPPQHPTLNNIFRKCLHHISPIYSPHEADPKHEVVAAPGLDETPQPGPLAATKQSKQPTPMPPSPASAPSNNPTSPTPSPNSSSLAPAHDGSPSSTAVHPLLSLLYTPSNTPQGTYVRTTALDLLIDSFLKSTPASSPKQILSLGAGTDTRYFRLRARGAHQELIYHEFDFPRVSAAKLQIVKSQPEIFLRDGAEVFQDDGDGMLEGGEWGIGMRDGEQSGARYFCHPLDLRSLPARETVHGLKSDVPTLVISECCLCYLEPSIASSVISWFTTRIPSLGIVLYEPIEPSDAFGQMMAGNLAARGIVMPTVDVFKTLSDQEQRMREAGYGAGAGAQTIERIWERWVGEGERERVDGLEGLDEVEEWQMLARHYAVVWGWTESLVWDLPVSS